MFLSSFHRFHPQAGAVADAASAAAADTARRTAVAGAQAAQKAAHVLGDARRSGQAAAEKALGSLMRAGGLAKKPKEAVLRDAARDEAAREEEELQAVLALSLKEFEAQQAKSVEDSPAAKQESSPGGQASACQEECQSEQIDLGCVPQPFTMDSNGLIWEHLGTTNWYCAWK